MAPTDQDTALTIHNKARTEKHLQPLHWDPNLASQATKYAQHLAQISELQHSAGSARPGQGENLYGTSSSHTPLADGARAWIGEGVRYHHEKIGEGDFGSYGHYSESCFWWFFGAAAGTFVWMVLIWTACLAQCMWKSTTHVGMGEAKGANGWIWVVGRYSPEGNMLGQTPY